MPVAASLYEWLMFLHVLAAMIWLGGIVTLGALATQVLRGGEPDAIARLVRSLRVVGPLVLAPAMVAVLGFGIWLVLDSDAWDFGQTWIWLALTLFAAAFLIGAIFQSRAAIGAERAATAGDGSEAARQLRRWSWGMGLIVVLLVVITWDMVIKPAS
jgi:uncharacterized membrane protein